ncbi:YbhB/YbcL family Raf kinase inhibitor-like protein [Bradyrhizobium sp. UFLA05-112]
MERSAIRGYHRTSKTLDFAPLLAEYDSYGGPCPPPGSKPHRYQITVFALDVERLPKATDASASPVQIESDIRARTLAKVTLTGRYGR